MEKTKITSNLIEYFGFAWLLSMFIAIWYAPLRWEIFFTGIMFIIIAFGLKKYNEKLKEDEAMEQLKHKTSSLIEGLKVMAKKSMEGI